MAAAACEYCPSKQHPLFLYFVTAEDGAVHVGVTRQPLVRLQEINHESGHLKAVDRWSRNHGVWKLVLAVGPFAAEKNAKIAKTIRRALDKVRQNIPKEILRAVEEYGVSNEVQWFAEDPDALLSELS